MIGLIEGIDARLPVRAPFAAYVAYDVHLVDFVVLDVTRRQADPIAQRRCFAVHVDEDETADDVAAHFAQTRPVRNQAGIEGCLIGDILELAVASELPAVERAGELGDAAAIVERYSIAAVRAYVVEGLDRSVVLPDHQDLFMTDLEHLVVAGFREVGSDSGQKPDARPKEFPFLFHEVHRGVTRWIGYVESVVDRGLLRFQ